MRDEVPREAGVDRLSLRLREARPVLEAQIREGIQRGVPANFEAREKEEATTD